MNKLLNFILLVILVVSCRQSKEEKPRNFGFERDPKTTFSLCESVLPFQESPAFYTKLSYPGYFASFYQKTFDERKVKYDFSDVKSIREYMNACIKNRKYNEWERIK